MNNFGTMTEVCARCTKESALETSSHSRHGANILVQSYAGISISPPF